MTSLGRLVITQTGIGVLVLEESVNNAAVRVESFVDEGVALGFAPEEHFEGHEFLEMDMEQLRDEIEKQS